MTNKNIFFGQIIKVAKGDLRYPCKVESNGFVEKEVKMSVNMSVKYYTLPDNPARWEERKEYFMSKPLKTLKFKIGKQFLLLRRLSYLYYWKKVFGKRP